MICHFLMYKDIVVTIIPTVNGDEHNKILICLDLQIAGKSRMNKLFDNKSNFVTLKSTLVTYFTNLFVKFTITLF